MNNLPISPGMPAMETRESWPEIDRLLPDSSIDLALCPTWYSAGKVMLDYVVAISVLPFALVFIAIAALAVWTTSSGPVFYMQTRIGLNGRRYKIIKIRTMHHGCELKSGIKWAKKNDDRVTLVGKFLRNTHLDELPQLFNVLKGDMSLVGPRPERPEVIQAKGLEQVVQGYALRLRVKPGVTGLAQVQLPADSDITGVRYKVVYDLYYVQHQGLLLDSRLILATIAKAMGISPKIIRLMFLLPNRQKIAEVIRTTPPTEHSPQAQLQPA